MKLYHSIVGNTIPNEELLLVKAELIISLMNVWSDYAINNNLSFLMRTNEENFPRAELSKTKMDLRLNLPSTFVSVRSTAP